MLDVLFGIGFDYLCRVRNIVENVRAEPKI